MDTEFSLKARELYLPAGGVPELEARYVWTTLSTRYIIVGTSNIHIPCPELVQIPSLNHITAKAKCQLLSIMWTSPRKACRVREPHRFHYYCLLPSSGSN